MVYPAGGYITSSDADIRASSDRYLRNAIIAVLAHDRQSTLWDAARLLSVGEDGYAYRRSVGAHVRTLPEFIERPNYFDVSVYGASGESVAHYMHRGSRVAIDGRLEWREWETEEHHKRQAVSIVADSVQFLDSPAQPPSDGGALDGPADSGESEEQDDERELVGVGVGEADLVF